MKEKVPRPGLSRVAQEILTFVGTYTDTHGWAPTVREIGKAVGLSSPSTVSHHLMQLEYKGYISRGYNQTRAIKVIP